ncbi:MAG: hypothetical protein GXY76_22770 [Chloroflexi bacterium]|nr:hypothetical protein [Chloroflexota bacterium]
MSISEAVRQPGGNGLASPAFQASLFFGVLGWQNVESGVEALVCDGELVPHTRTMADFMRLLGRRRFVRRVMLRPAPLEVSAAALTSDQRQLTLTIAVKYEVTNPVHVASLQSPLSELTNLAIGTVAEYIRTKTFGELVGGGDATRARLLECFGHVTSIRDGVAILEILKAEAVGDERLIEIERKTAEAKAAAALVDTEWRNHVIEAGYQEQIRRGQAAIEEERAQREHARDMEKMRLEKQAGLIEAGIATLGQVAASGMDPTRLTQEVANLWREQIQNPGQDGVKEIASPKATAGLPEGKAALADTERTALASIKDSIKMVSYEVIESQGRVKGALIQMSGYEIVFSCDENYPQARPLVTVRYPDGRSLQPQVFWVPGISNSLAQAVLVVASHAQRVSGS